VVSFAADFEQHCEGTTPALFGTIRFNSGAPMPPRISLTLLGCTHCRVGDRVIVQGRLTNPGAARLRVEVKLGLRRPDGTGVSLFGVAGEHFVMTLPPYLDTTFPVVNFSWPVWLPAGVWHVEGTVLEPALGRQFSRDVKVFVTEP
jgi:hypothetical protein